MTEIFIFTLLLRHQKEVWKNKVCYFPPYLWLGQHGLRLFLSNSVFLILKIHKNNIDTSWVTNKHYYKKHTFLKLFMKQNWHLQRVTANYYTLFPRKLYKLYFLSQLETYSKYLLTGISANSTFRTVFNFKKLKIII